MARRVPLSDPDAAIAALKADGGVILTGFATALEVEQVNADAQPYLDAILKGVSRLLLPCPTKPFSPQAPPILLKHGPSAFLLFLSHVAEECQKLKRKTKDIGANDSGRRNDPQFHVLYLLMP